MSKIQCLKSRSCSFSGRLRNLFAYSSVVTTDIDNICIGLIYRFVQFIILTYIIGYELLYKKGYQSFEIATGTVTSKVKGFGIVPITNKTIDGHVINFPNGTLPPNFYKILDTADYVIPPNEFNSIFVMTNVLQTEQTQGTCEEDFTKLNAECTEDSDCYNATSNNWNGVPTGKCINSTRKKGIKVCEVNAWCPVEYETKDTNSLVRNVLNFTIFLRNTVEFKAFDKKERNILPTIAGDYIAKCAYDRPRDPECPVFLIDDIINEAEEDRSERLNLLKKGAIIEIKITWDCNYDTLRTHCQPRYSFERFDFSSKESRTVSGFNFRYADKVSINGVVKRTLYKVYGIRFVINIMGRAGKFNLVQLLLTCGACLGLLSISSLIADFVMLSLCISRRTYHRSVSQNPDGTIQAEIEDKVENANKVNQDANMKESKFKIGPEKIKNTRKCFFESNSNSHPKDNSNTTTTETYDSITNEIVQRKQLIKHTLTNKNGHKIRRQVWVTTDDYNEIIQHGLNPFDDNNDDTSSNAKKSKK